MNLFKKKPKPQLPQADYSVLGEVISIISRGDTAPLDEMTECLRDRDEYISKHRERYDERFMDTGATAKDDFFWLTMVDILLENNYVGVIDWKFEAKDILFNLKPVAAKLDIDLQGIVVDEDAYTLDALRQISAELLAKHNCALGYIDTGSDEYSLFLTEPRSTAALAELAMRYGSRYPYKISFAFEE
jgi:hypothetical protein